MRILREEFAYIMNLISICEKCKIQPLSLKGIGFNEFAFTYEQIKKIIELLRIKKISILGGDVYIQKGGEIIITSDSWYIKKDKIADYEYSYKKTIDYIEIFESKEEDYIYSIVLKE